VVTFLNGAFNYFIFGIIIIIIIMTAYLFAFATYINYVLILLVLLYKLMFYSACILVVVRKQPAST
jgi:hypothetical protein